MPDGVIQTFCGAGPKQWAMAIKDKEGNMTYSLKLRGVSLNEENDQRLNFDIFRDMVLSIKAGVTPQPVHIPNAVIRPSRQLGVTTEDLSKKYSCVFNKGFLVGNYVFPFGFKRPSDPSTSHAEDDSITID